MDDIINIESLETSIITDIEVKLLNEKQINEKILQMLLSQQTNIDQMMQSLNKDANRQMKRQIGHLDNIITDEKLSNNVRIFFKCVKGLNCS